MIALFAGGCARAPRQVAAVPPPGAPAPAPKLEIFNATAYSIDGTTAAGTPAREGIVAADPGVLPLGTRIRVHDAGKYSGEYVVKDTGAKIKGREIDIFLANDSEAKRFGKRAVKVEVVRRVGGR